MLQETVAAAEASPVSPCAQPGTQLAGKPAEQQQAAAVPDQPRSAAQADANMAALLQEEAGYVCSMSRSSVHGSIPRPQALLLTKS